MEREIEREGEKRKDSEYIIQRVAYIIDLSKRTISGIH